MGDDTKYFPRPFWWPKHEAWESDVMHEDVELMAARIQRSKYAQSSQYKKSKIALFVFQSGQLENELATTLTDGQTYRIIESLCYDEKCDLELGAFGDHDREIPSRMQVVQIFKAYMFFLSKGAQLTVENIKAAHAILMKNSDAHPGHLRTESARGSFNNKGTDMHYLEPVDDAIPRALEKLVAEVNKTTDWLSAATLAAAKFLHIHPFKDGNGRMARIIISCIFQTRLRLPFPIVISNSHRRARSHWVRALYFAQCRHSDATLRALLLESIWWAMTQLQHHLELLPIDS
jgi:hypothetical protein